MRSTNFLKRVVTCHVRNLTTSTVYNEREILIVATKLISNTGVRKTCESIVKAKAR